jgi:hypothetical protein
MHWGTPCGPFTQVAPRPTSQQQSFAGSMPQEPPEHGPQSGTHPRHAFWMQISERHWPGVQQTRQKPGFPVLAPQQNRSTSA